MRGSREGRREAFTGETMGQVLSCETGLIPRCRSHSVEEKATSSHGEWLAWEEPRAKVGRGHSTCEATEQGEATTSGSRGGKGPHPRGKQPLGGRGSDTEPKYRVDPNHGCAVGR